MPKEIRAILFTSDEVRTVVEHFLAKNSSGRAARSVERVDLEITEGALYGKVFLARGAEPQQLLLGAQDMMTAVLMYCSHIKIPMSIRALKQLEPSTSGLMLTMSLSPQTSTPRVTANRIEYSAPIPAEMTDAVKPPPGE